MRNQTIRYIGLIGVMIVGIIFFISKRSSIITETNQRPRPQQQMERQQTKAGQIVGTTKQPGNTITTKELENLRNAMPDKLKVKNEFNENPHIPPASLRKFANSMGPLMEKAIKRSGDASLLNHELYDCALNESFAEAARATCVMNSERLVKLFPQVKVKEGDLRSNISEDVQKILNTRDKFITK